MASFEGLGPLPSVMGCALQHYSCKENFRNVSAILY